MSVCPSCSGVIGRDCFNPSECAAIGAMQEEDARRNVRNHDEAITQLYELVASLQGRIEALEKQKGPNPL